MSDVLFYVSIAGYTLFAVCIVISVILFFKLDILYVIKDLNGTIAQKEISVLREKTISSKNNRVQIYDPDKNGEKGSGRMSGGTGENSFGSAAVNAAKGADLFGPEMQTTILEHNKVINKDFVIVTDIVFINTEEKL